MVKAPPLPRRARDEIMSPLAPATTPPTRSVWVRQGVPVQLLAVTRVPNMRVLKASNLDAKKRGGVFSKAASPYSRPWIPTAAICGRT